MFTLTRSEHNPIISPVREHPWEAAAAFNGCPIMDGQKTRMVYRAMSEPDLLREPHARMSVIAAAESKDGFHYENRHVLVSPDREFDLYGCEDPRVTKLGGVNYIFYTALGGYPFSADNIKVAVALTKDFETIDEKHLVTPFNAKAMALFPAKIGGKMAALLTVNTDRKPSDICYAEFDKPEDMWSPEFWNEWWKSLDSHKIHIRRFPTDHLELGAPPVLTEKGWLVVYSHIQRYGQGDQVFGIEIVLLDEKNPRQIIGRTKGPFMVPNEYYENTGQVPHVIFPTGALIRDGRLEVHYGAADTHCAVATIPLENLLHYLTDQSRSFIKRFPGNPIIAPRPSMLWETKGTFNPAAIDLGGKTHIIYRAVSADNVSTLGYASSVDGLSIDERLDKPIFSPRADFESRGCEDPRLQLIDGRVYMTYTAYDGSTPRVAVSSIASADFAKKRWAGWTKPEIITPASIANKDAAMLPEPIKGGYMVFHRVNESVCADFVNSLDFSKEKITQCIEVISPRRGMWDGGKVGLSTPPVKTKHGWMLLYHGVSWSTTYRIGAVLLDLNDPTIVKARTAVPLFEPEEQYEQHGAVPNVVFPCGLVIRGQTAFMYYGAGDDVVGVATMKMSALLRALEI
ncbi:hypothetical protein KGP36_06580 [Patescibacteria group bacterium]|nr:hypothetical protein [Patescibacteria group bacterium]MDE1941062.1 hypothetical protein [Patescibacteria group bacterium]